jgi:hypothetical protein
MAELPPLNRRIKDLIAQKTGKANRNVSLFAEMISEGRDKPIVQQRIDKILNTENPSTVAADILEAILNRFADIDAYWLITGKEKSGAGAPDQMLSQIRKYAQAILELSSENEGASLQSVLSSETTLNLHHGRRAKTSDRTKSEKTPKDKSPD